MGDTTLSFLEGPNSHPEGNGSLGGLFGNCLGVGWTGCSEARCESRTLGVVALLLSSLSLSARSLKRKRLLWSLRMKMKESPEGNLEFYIYVIIYKKAHNFKFSSSSTIVCIVIFCFKPCIG